jgi:hypothetical protein
MMDLFKNKYDIETLINNIYALNMVDIVKTQTLNEKFIVKYILNKNYQLTEEEQTMLTLGFILQHQPHITKTKLLEVVDNVSQMDDSDCIYELPYFDA